MSMTGDYPNRSDLRGAPQANFTGQTYGDAKAQREAQQAVPTGAPPSDTPGGLMLPGPVPGAAAFNRMSERPDEPITAGANFGPGPSAREAGMIPRVLEFDDTLMQLQALYQKYPNPGLRKFLMRYQNRMY